MSNDEHDESADEGTAFLTLAEIAEELRVSRGAVRRYLTDAGVRVYQFGQGANSKIRVAREDVNEWIESCADDADDQDADDQDADDQDADDQDADDQDADDSESNPGDDGLEDDDGLGDEDE